MPPRRAVQAGPSGTTSRPAAVDAIGQPSDMAVNVRPATVGPYPMTPCTYVGAYVTRPIISRPAAKVATLARRINGSRHRSTPSRGSATTRCLRANSSPNDAATAINPTLAPTPQATPCVSTSIVTLRATKKSPAPATSMLRSRVANRSCRKARRPKIATMPSGTLNQKIHCHPTVARNAPPSNGPTIAEMPHTLARYP